MLNLGAASESFLTQCPVARTTHWIGKWDEICHPHLMVWCTLTGTSVDLCSQTLNINNNRWVAPCLVRTCEHLSRQEWRPDRQGQECKEAGAQQDWMGGVHGLQVPRMPAPSQRLLQCLWRTKSLCAHVLTFSLLSSAPGCVTTDILGVLLP